MRIGRNATGRVLSLAAAALLGAFAARNLPDEAKGAALREGASTQKAQSPSSGGPLVLPAFPNVARQATPGVVNISTSKVVKDSPARDPFWDLFEHDLFERFFRGPGNRPRTERSLGSGFVVDAVGYILTNRHVVEGADEITVSFDDRRRYEAKLVGRDQRTDVALLKIEPKEPLSALPLGDSDEVEVGDWVMAVGNPFGLGGNSVTVGVVSFKGRPFDLGGRRTPVVMLQTDAAINPGNSGGPLVDLEGRVVGINTLIVTQGTRQSAGVGFAVPVDVVKRVLPQLRETGRVVRGWLGVLVQPLTEDLAQTLGLEKSRGAIVAQVTPGSPAEKAGLKPEDVVLAVDGHEIADSVELTSAISGRAPGTKLSLRVLRAGAEKDVELTLGTFPDEEGPRADEATNERLGLTLRELNPALAARLGLPEDLAGLAVSQVAPGSAAEEAGLRPRDVILRVGGNPVKDRRSFDAEIDRARPKGAARLYVRRGDGHLLIAVRLSARGE